MRQRSIGFCSDRVQYTWRIDGQSLTEKNVPPKIKLKGGNIMIWGCMAWSNPGAIVQLVVRMNALQYISIVQENPTQSKEATYLLGDMRPI